MGPQGKALHLLLTSWLQACRETVEPPEPTLAEELLNLAHGVLYPRHELLCFPENDPVPWQRRVAIVKVALDLYHRPKVFQLRAIVEDWGPFQMIRELY